MLYCMKINEILPWYQWGFDESCISSCLYMTRALYVCFRDIWELGLLQIAIMNV